MLSIAYFQSLPKFNDIRFNLNNISNLLYTNKKKIKHSDLVIFPEYTFSGSLNLEAFVGYKKQLSKINVKEELLKLSTSYPKTTFIFGSAIVLHDKEYKNMTWSLKNGKILAEYSKKALIYNENYICKSSNEYPVFNVGDIKVGMAICWDLILPEVFRHYINKIDLIVVPSFWGIGGNALQARYSFSLEKKYYRELCIARSYENAFALVFVNSVGKYTSPFYNDRMMGGVLPLCLL